MKKYIAVMIALTGLHAYAADVTKNTIRMVTYFPVPYVAYSKINVAEQLDVGLGTTNSCALALGCPAFQDNTSTPVLSTNRTQLNASVKLNNAFGLAIYSSQTGVNASLLELGSSSAGNPKFNFSGSSTNLRLDGMVKSSSANFPAFTSLNTSILEVRGGDLLLFATPNGTGAAHTSDGQAQDFKFPTCKGKGTNTTGQMAWTELALGPDGSDSGKEIYLACVGGSTAVCNTSICKCGCEDDGVTCITCPTYGWQLQDTASKTNQACDSCHGTGNSGPQCHSYGSLITSTSLPAHWSNPNSYTCSCNNTDESLGSCPSLIGECCGRDQAPICNENRVGKYYRYHDYVDQVYDPEVGRRFGITSSIYKCVRTN